MRVLRCAGCNVQEGEIHLDWCSVFKAHLAWLEVGKDDTHPWHHVWIMVQAGVL